MKNKYNVFCLWTLIILVVSPSQATVVLDYHSRVLSCDTRESGQDLKLSCGDAFSRYEVNVYGVHESHPWTQVRGPIELSCKAQYTGSFVEQAEAYREIDRLIGDGEFKWVDVNKKMQMGAQTTDLLILCDFIDAQKAKTIFMKTDPDYRLETTLISQEDNSQQICECNAYKSTERYVICQLRGQKVLMRFAYHPGEKTNTEILDHILRVLRKSFQDSNLATEQFLNNLKFDILSPDGEKRKQHQDDYAIFRDIYENYTYYAVEQSQSHYLIDDQRQRQQNIIGRGNVFSRLLIGGLEDSLVDELGVLYFQNIGYASKITNDISLSKVVPIGPDDINAEALRLSGLIQEGTNGVISEYMRSGGVLTQEMKDEWNAIASSGEVLPGIIYDDVDRLKSEDVSRRLYKILLTFGANREHIKKLGQNRERFRTTMKLREQHHARELIKLKEDVFLEMGIEHRRSLQNELIEACRS